MIEGFRKVCAAAALTCEFLEHPGVSICIGIVVDADGVNRGTRSLGTLEDVFQFAVTCVIPAITQYDERFSSARAAFQMLDSCDECVVQGGESRLGAF